MTLILFHQAGLRVLLNPKELALQLRLGLAVRALSYHEAHGHVLGIRSSDETEEVFLQY